MDNRLAAIAALIGVALVGLITASGLSGNSDVSTQSNASGITGHVALTIYDTSGSIKQYIQGDNVILDDGDNCILEKVFVTEVTGCAGTAGSNAVFNVVSIGTSGTAATEGNTALLAATDTATGTVGSPTAASGGSASSVTVTRTFTDPGAATYREAALSNTDTDYLARNTFTTAATLTATDDLVVQWTINIDG